MRFQNRNIWVYHDVRRFTHFFLKLPEYVYTSKEHTKTFFKLKHLFCFVFDTKQNVSKVISVSVITKNYETNLLAPRNGANLYHNKRTVNFTAYTSG
jgi:hypothetical protein